MTAYRITVEPPEGYVLPHSLECKICLFASGAVAHLEDLAARGLLLHANLRRVELHDSGYYMTDFGPSLLTT